MASAKKVDVFICGGGPVGLLMAYQLVRMGLSVHIVEQHDKLTQAAYGRAATFYPRTTELLDQLDLAEAALQIGFICRNAATYDAAGVKVQGRGYTFIHKIRDTFFDFMLSIRQRFTENIIRDAIAGHGVTVNAPAKLVALALEEEESIDYRIHAQVEENDTMYSVQAKYIVGADGGKSTVRTLAGIPFPGSRTTHRWIRIDGIVKTDMPMSRIGLCTVESSTHGNVLWACLDHGVTRVGFSLSAERYAKYGRDMTVEDVKREAIAAVAPFNLEFLTVEWWTIYAIEQRLADTFQQHDRVFLVGYAAHTHSSGAAQGLNTGIQDAANLGWKLGGVLKGWYNIDVLATYTQERRENAVELIRFDKLISDLLSGIVPDGYSDALLHKDPNVILADQQEKYAEVIFGLGIHYAPDAVLNRANTASNIPAGYRVPDMLLRRPGVNVPIRLYEITKNNGKFWVIVFAGNAIHTAVSVKAFRAYVDDEDSFTRQMAAITNFATVIAGNGLQVDETLGVEPFGNAYYDVDASVHNKLGVPATLGGVFVVRPDGYLGFAAPLGAGPEVARYLQTVGATTASQGIVSKSGAQGQIINGVK